MNIQKYKWKEIKETDCMFANEQLIVIAKIAEEINQIETLIYGTLTQIYFAQLMFNAVCIHMLSVSCQNYREICLI